MEQIIKSGLPSLTNQDEKYLALLRNALERHGEGKMDILKGIIK